MGKMYNRFRLEELPVVADLLLLLLKRDQDYFTSFSLDFNEVYRTNVETQILRIQNLTSPQTISAEKAKLTSTRYQVMEQIKHVLNRVDAYVYRASDQLQVLSADFGIREAKQELKRKNVEGSVMRMKEVEQNIANNLRALQTKGYKIELGLELQTLTQRMADMNLLKIEMISQRKQLVIDNHIQYQLLWNFIVEISDIGKLVMRADKSKADEYKFCNLLNHIRKATTGSRDSLPQEYFENE